MHTEREAAERWCPFVRAGDSGLPGHNRWTSGIPSSTPLYTHCIASACMAWRWGPPEPVPVSRTPFMAPGVSAGVQHAPTPTPTKGYCGLVGRTA